MLIVITKDPVIVEFRKKAHSGAPAWGPVHFIDAKHGQDAASKQLISLLGSVKADEPLCLVGHGNDEEVGGKGKDGDDWGWTAREMAQLLCTHLKFKPGPILFEVCSDEPEETEEKHEKMHVIGFGTVLHKEINTLGVPKLLRGATIYSYNSHILSEHTLPDPTKIHKSMEVQPSIL
jgi:hypothetical protein